MDKKWNQWRAGHISCIAISACLVIACILLLIYTLGIKEQNFENWITIVEIVLSLLFLGMAVPLFKFGFKIFKPNIESQIREEYKSAYLSNGISDEIKGFSKLPELIQSTTLKVLNHNI